MRRFLGKKPHPHNSLQHAKSVLATQHFLHFPPTISTRLLCTFFLFMSSISPCIYSTWEDSLERNKPSKGIYGVDKKKFLARYIAPSRVLKAFSVFFSSFFFILKRLVVDVWAFLPLFNMLGLFVNLAGVLPSGSYGICCSRYICINVIF